MHGVRRSYRGVGHGVNKERAVLSTMTAVGQTSVTSDGSRKIDHQTRGCYGVDGRQKRFVRRCGGCGGCYGAVVLLLLLLL